MVGIAESKELKLAWDYNKAYLEFTDGFRVYSGNSEGSLVRIAEIPTAAIEILSEKPVLLNERFDSDPGSKYNVTQGSWQWVSKTKNMKVESSDFMVVFELPAGTDNTMSFWFWPEKGLGDQAQLYVYNKDEAETALTGFGSYYELRFGSLSGTRYSNFRKCYGGDYGGVDPNGAFPLPRFDECNIVEGQANVCDGYWLRMTWKSGSDGYYGATVFNQKTQATTEVSGRDAKALNINKLEIILKDQSGWIDNIVIGGQVVLSKLIDVDVTQLPKYFAVTAYNGNGESDKSDIYVYDAQTGELVYPNNFRINGRGMR